MIGSSKDIQHFRKFNPSQADNILLIVGTKMSNHINDVILDDNGNEHYMDDIPGNCSYIICDDKVYTTNDILRILEKELRNIKNSSTIAIMIGIDN